MHRRLRSLSPFVMEIPALGKAERRGAELGRLRGADAERNYMGLVRVTRLKDNNDSGRWCLG